MDKIKEKRFGILKFSSHVLKDICDDVVYNPLSLIDFIPFHVECDYCRDLFVMKGFSHLFDIIEVGVKIPLYEIIINRSDEGVYTATVKKDI